MFTGLVLDFDKNMREMEKSRLHRTDTQDINSFRVKTSAQMFFRFSSEYNMVQVRD